MSHYRNAGLFLVLAVGWGGSYPAMKYGLEHGLTPVFYAGLRFDVAAIIFLGYVVWRVDNWLPRTRDDVAYLFISAIFIVALNNAFLLLGQNYTASGVAAMVYSLNPVLSAGFARVLLPSEGFTRTELLGLGLGLIGVGIIAHPDPGNFGRQSYGIGCLLLAAGSVALGSVLSRRTEPRVSTLAGSAWAMLVGAGVLHMSAVIYDGGPTVQLTPTLGVAVVFLGVIGTAVAYGAYFTLLGAIGPVRTNLVSYLVPIIASVAGWIILGSPMTMLTIAGFIVIFVGFVLLNVEAFATEAYHISTLIGNR